MTSNIQSRRRSKHIGTSAVLQWVTYFVVAVFSMNHCSAFCAPPTSTSCTRTISTTTTTKTLHKIQSIPNNDTDDDDDDRINSVLNTKKKTFISSITNEEEDCDIACRELVLRESLLTTRLDLPFLRNRSKVKTSTIDSAGRGLFAERTIKEGEIITCSPGDALLLFGSSSSQPSSEEEEVRSDDESVLRPTTATKKKIIWGSHVKENDRWDDDTVFNGSETKPPLMSTALFVDDMYAILGHPDLDEDSAYYGHYANDGAGHIMLQKDMRDSNNDDDDETAIEEMESNYFFESLEVNNAKNRPLGGEGEKYHTVIVATQDIQAGEEIFVMYGPDYWLGHS